jgi:hypothetical protein
MYSALERRANIARVVRERKERLQRIVIQYGNPDYLRSEGYQCSHCPNSRHSEELWEDPFYFGDQISLRCMLHMEDRPSLVSNRTGEIDAGEVGTDSSSSNPGPQNELEPDPEPEP